MSTVEAPKLNYTSDLNNESRGVAYVCPNEDTAIWRELVRGKRIKRAAGICSGGEVGFLALLPSVREELILVDHNLGSLKYAILKYLLLRERGYAGFLRLLNDQEAFKAALLEIEKQLPEPFKTEQEDSCYRMRHIERLARKVDTPDYSLDLSLREMWDKIPNTYEKRQAASKLDKVKFLHGDFEALSKYGKFDLLYVSNAHQSGNGNDFGDKNLEVAGECLNPGAYVLISCQLPPKPKQEKYVLIWDGINYVRVESDSDAAKKYYEAQRHHRRQRAYQPENWKLIKTAERRTGRAMSRWTYNLYQVQS